MYNMSTELTLADIQRYLNTDNFKFTANTPCNTKIQNIISDASYNISQADTFLLKQIYTTTNSFNTSSTTRDNFLELYNEQYARNMETFVGILIISIILAKMMFYPTAMPKL